MAGIKNISVTAAGSGYTSVPTVSIASGFITELTIQDPGSGYIGTHSHGRARGGASSTITLASAADSTDDHYNNAAIYITAGTGSGQLRTISDYTGSTRVANVSVAWTTQPDSTSRYEIGPAVSFSGGGGSNAEAVAIVRGGTIQQVFLTNAGSSYTTLPTITVTDASLSSGSGAVLLPGIDVGGGATAEAVLTGTSIASVSVANPPVPNSAGTPAAPTYTAPPNLVVKPSNGDEPTTPAVLTAVLTATTIMNIVVTDAGEGYTGAPTIAITGGGGSGGAATATVSGGAVNAISSLTAGSGYTSTPTVTFSGGGATTQATAVAVLTPTSVASVTVDTAGDGYTAIPTITAFPTQVYGDLQAQTPPMPGADVYYRSVAVGTAGTATDLTAVLTATTLGSVKITATGASYGVVPAVSLSGGGGSGATLEAELSAYNINSTQEKSRKGVESVITKRQPSDQVDTTGSYAASGGRVPQKLKVGQLAMMKGGLFRVTGVEAISFGQPLGLQGSVTSHTAGATTFTIELDEAEPNLQSITIPGSSKIVFGDGDRIREVGQMTSADVSFSSGSATFTLTGVLTRDADFGVGTTVRIQFIPGNSGSSTNFLLEEFTIDGLDTLSRGDDEVVYHLGFGLNYTPKYIAADGSFAKAGRSNTSESSLTNVENSVAYDSNFGGSMVDDAGKLIDDSAHAAASANTAGSWGEATFGTRTTGGASRTLVGFTSARVRVFQPKGVPKFTAQAVGFRDDTSTDENGIAHNDDLMINPTGFITANESPAIQPNPTYMLWVGSGEETLPQFQVAANDEDIIDPRISFTGHKYSLRPVPEAEVRRMQRRSGGYKYEVIPYALDAYESETLGRGTAGPAGPRDGWHVHVRSHKGTPMNKTEYDNATNQATPMTNNMLNGASSRRANRSRDPRSAHRRDY